MITRHLASLSDTGSRIFFGVLLALALYVAIGNLAIPEGFLFHVPMEGSLLLLAGLSTLFIAANLSVGYTFSTIARNQLQAVQMTFLFFMPNLLLSGFMFPFRGMPEWAQAIGTAIPVTHFLRVVRGSLLKGVGLAENWPSLAALAVFVIAVTALAMARYRTTLD